MKRIAFLSLVAIIGLLILYGLDRYYCETEYRESLMHVNQFTERVQFVLTRSIPDKLSVVEDLKSFLVATEHQASNESFDQYAAWVLAHNPSLYWLAYTDQAQVIRRIYPLIGNESAVNLDLKERPDDIPWFQRAILMQRTILSPPMQALQGFEAVVAYTPLLKDTEFQGLAIGLFRLDKVIDYALMDIIRDEPNHFVVITDTTGQILWRSGPQDIAVAVSRMVFPVGEAEWTAYVGWRNQPQPDPLARRLLWGSGVTIVLLLLVIFNGILNRNIWLAQMVEEKIVELASHNIQLTEEVEERKKAEEALRASERRLDKFVTAIPDIIYQINKNGIILDFRVRDKSDLLAPPVSLLNRSIFEFFPAEVADVYLGCIAQALASDQVKIAEYSVTTDDGCKYYEARFVANGADEIFVVIRNITERKQLLTIMLEAEEARARSEKLASLATMAAGISHEINQPLNSIKVITTGILFAYHKGRERELSDMIKAMEEISQQADRINNIISHMRAFIRGDESQTVPCQWNTAVEQSLQVVGKQLEAHGIRVDKHLIEELPMILATPTALEEIVINLIVNAMQALDTIKCDNKKIVIRTFYLDGVVLEISDNGPGVADENRKKIFTPFYSTKLGTENLGLGLSIVYSIVTSYQGKACVVDRSQDGAIFQVTIPAYRNEDERVVISENSTC